MLYASAKGTLKSKLGFSYFDVDLHYSNVGELSYAQFMNEKKLDGRSNDEIARDKMVREMM